MTLVMTPVIATREMIRSRPDGVQTTITVQIGTPAPTPPGSVYNGWYCPVQFQGLPFQTVFFGMGDDSAQALIHALTLPFPILTAMPFANELNYSCAPTFGFPEMPPLPPLPSVVSGTVQMELCNDPAQNITFEFRTPGTSPYDPTNPVPALQTVHQILTPLTPDGDTGYFAIPGVPDGTYDLAIKGYCWLRKVIPGVVVNGANVSGLSAFLTGGDINNDNYVDSTDFGTLIGDFGAAGDP